MVKKGSKSDTVSRHRQDKHTPHVHYDKQLRKNKQRITPSFADTEYLIAGVPQSIS